MQNERIAEITVQACLNCYLPCAGLRKENSCLRGTRAARRAGEKIRPCPISDYRQQRISVDKIHSVWYCL